MDEIFLTRGQFAVFGWCLLAGVLAGACYTLARALRAVLGGGKIATVLTDVAWGSAAVAIAAWAGLRWAGGELRLFWVAAAIAGCLCYLLTVHKYLAKCGEKIYTVLKPKRDAFVARFQRHEEQTCKTSDSTPSARRPRHRRPKKEKSNVKKKRTSGS